MPSVSSQSNTEQQILLIIVAILLCLFLMFRNKERIIKRTLHSRHYTNIEDSDSDAAVELSIIDEDVDDVQHSAPCSFPIINDIENMDEFEKNEI